MAIPEVQSFSLPLFNNYYGLQRLVKGEEAIAEIEARAKDQAFSPDTHATYFSKWHIIWIDIKQPFELITSLFLAAISRVASLIRLQKAARIFSVLSAQMLRDWDQLGSQRDIKSPLLMPAFNAHQTNTWDLYMHGTIPTDFIEDDLTLPMTAKSGEFNSGVKQAMKAFYHTFEKERDQYWLSWVWRGDKVSKAERQGCTLQFSELYAKSPDEAFSFLSKKYSEKATEHAIQACYDVLTQADAYIAKNCSNISLFSDKGLCRGASLWFINLYLKTKAKFEDPVKHLIAVAEQFKTGVPRQGALLQSFYDTDRLLDIQRTNIKQSRVSSYELDHDRASALKKIETLSAGIYRVGTGTHSLVYIKLNKSEGYVWDPEFGLYGMTADKLLNMILKHHYKPADPTSHIYFHKYENGG